MENFLSDTSLVNYIYYHVRDNLTRQFDEEYIFHFFHLPLFSMNIVPVYWSIYLYLMLIWINVNKTI